ncbi:MAG TPA: TonB-dependent receptor plug domain-containing protein, partial [Chitinophagaceae bacterium]|nr:TonB-dependent receptor plug domain-containing protein [Chitinophagaceae bacterium]
MGYKTKEISIKGKSFITESLEATDHEMESVVVIGYQTASRKSISTSVASVSAKDIAPYVTGNVANALQGKVPGLQVISGGGLPGAQPRILIHGLSSINYNNNPLIIVDGVETGFNSLNLINPLDIESMDVLEDASAAAIYGARGGQGVILVTTKKGRGNPSINVSASTGFNMLPDTKLADANEFVRIMNQEAQASGQTLPFPDPSKVTNTNYWDRTFDVGRTQNYNISASGGKNGLSLYGSLGYFREDSYNATNKGGYWQKMTGRFDADMNISSKIKMGINLAPRYETWLNSPNNIYAAYVMDPTTEPFKTVDSVNKSIPNGFMDMTAFNPYYSQPNRSSFSGITNPAFNYVTNFGKNDFFGTQYSTYLQITPIKNLVIKSSVEGFVDVTQSNNYTPKYYLAPNSYNKQSTLTSSTVVATRWKIVNTANYKLTVGQHHVDVLAGESTDKYI